MPNCTLSVSPCTIDDIVDRNAEPLGHDLRERRLVALAVGVAAGEDFDRAGRIDPHLGGFP